MKKIIILLIALVLTGCNAEYNIHISKDKIIEEIYFIENKEKATKLYEEYGESYFSDKLINIEIGNEFYKRKLVNKDDENFAYKYEENFNFDRFDNETISKKCYENISIKKDENIIIKTSDKFWCYEMVEELEEVKIILTSDYKIIKNNADKIEKNKYIWIINKNNQDNKPIYLELKDNSVSKNIFNYVYLFCGISFTIIAIKYLKNKKKEFNP